MNNDYVYNFMNAYTAWRDTSFVKEQDQYTGRTYIRKLGITDVAPERKEIENIIRHEIVKMHGYDLDGAKFKIGELILANHSGNTFNARIIAVSIAEDRNDVECFEYWVENYPAALWEYEIQHVRKTCSYCGTTQPLDNSHCISCGAVVFEQK